MATPTKSTYQHTAPNDNGNTVAAVRLAFAQAKVDFSALRIKQPLTFIQWRRPELTTDEVRRIRMGLSGRAAGSDMHLATVCKSVIEELKAA